MICGLAHFDISECIEGLKDMQMLLRETGWSPASHLKGYRRKLHQRQPIAPFQHLEEVMVRDVTKATLQDWNSLLAFPQRVTFQDLDCLEEATVEEAMVHFEKSGSYDHACVAEMSTILREWLKDLDESKFWPTVSNGATTTVKRKEPLAYKLCEIGDFSGVQLLGDIHQSYDAEFQCVPKSATKKRGITKCDTNIVYYTLGVFNMIDYLFSTKLRQHVDLHNTELSTSKIRGANSMYYGTLDLSSASDMFHYCLMRDLFAESVLIPYIVNFHVDNVKFKDVIIRSVMHAPMGAGTCFPIMTLVLCAACELACRRTGCSPSYVVYGDDIVIGSTAYYELRDVILPSLGLIVNYSKSYPPEHAFKEACGEETWNGVSIKPLRVPRRLDAESMLKRETRSLECLLDMYDSAYEYGYSTVCEFLEHTVHNLWNTDVPFITPAGHLLYQSRPKARWNEKLQRHEFRVACVSTQREGWSSKYVASKEKRALQQRLQSARVTEQDLLYRYTLYSIARRVDAPDQPFDGWLLWSTSRIRRKWVPTPEELESWILV